MSTRKTQKTDTPTTNEALPPVVQYPDGTTRFDLEDAIMQCWHTCDDIELLINAILEPPEDDELLNDRLANALIGLKELHHLRSSKLFDIFSVLVALREFKSG